MTKKIPEQLLRSKRVATVVGALLAALALSLMAGQAEAQIPGCQSDCPPGIRVDNGTVTVNEGQTATNSGTFSDLDGADTVVISASRGTVSRTTTTFTSGTWSWQEATTDGPFQSEVTITASDGTSQRTTLFTLTVNNVPPTATFNAPDSVNGGSGINLSLTNPFDPSSIDRSRLKYAFDCGSGVFGGLNPSNSHVCPTSVDGSGTRLVRGKVRDEDGGETTYSHTVSVNDVNAPTVGSVTPLAGQTGVLTNTNVTVTFSEEMDPATLTPSTVQLFKDQLIRVRKKKGKKRRWVWVLQRVPVSGQVSCDDPCKTAALDPSSPLPANSNYLAVVTTGAKDEAGNTLAQNHSWTFATGSS